MAANNHHGIIGLVTRGASLGAAVLACALTARADSLTITYQDLTTLYSKSTTVSSPPGFPPGVFGGTLDDTYGSIGYHVEGSANPPGSTIDSPTAAYLSSTQFSLTNTSTTSHHIVITFDAETFTLPVAN